MQLSIEVARRSDTGYQARCPALPGCVVWGSSRREALSRIQDAIEGYLCSMDVALPRELRRRLHNEMV